MIVWTNKIPTISISTIHMFLRSSGVNSLCDFRVRCPARCSVTTPKDGICSEKISPPTLVGVACAEVEPHQKACLFHLLHISLEFFQSIRVNNQ